MDESSAMNAMNENEAHPGTEDSPAGAVPASPEDLSPRKNPFVGPVPFTKDDPIFGRNREIRDLFDQVISHRIVVLHSPSGAGKTSLVMAGLLPRLEQEGFYLLPIIRVGGEPEQDFQPPKTFNPYVYNLILALDSHGVEEGRADSDESLHQETLKRRSERHQELAGLTLAEYLAQWPVGEGVSTQIIVFDQFEEIITSSLGDQQCKRDFFRQVGEALRDQHLWALFVIRDDFLGALEPYAFLIPTQFIKTFRLDFLDYDAALEAIRLPLAGQGISFVDEADEQLLNDLRTIKVQTPDGEAKLELGEYVEPVQLQVVCRRLYNRLNLADRLDKTSIDRQDLASVGDVNQALAEYYREQVRLVAEKRSAERRIRDWFEDSLITKTGLRSQVMMDKDSSGGLDNRVIWKLVDGHLVRGEKRRGVTWFELAHDRLMQPVLADNDVWRNKELDRVQQRAWEWKKQNRPDSLLLRGKELEAANTWASEHAEELDDLDREYLEAGRLWRRENLGLMQLKASQWIEENRPDSLLLQGAELAQAEAWAAEHANEMTEQESIFLAESRKFEMEELHRRQRAKLAEEYQRNRRRMLLVIGAVITLVGLASAILLLLSNNATRIANLRQAQAANNAALAATNAAIAATNVALAAEKEKLAIKDSTQAAESNALASDYKATAAADRDILAVSARIALTAMAQEATTRSRLLALQARSFLERKPDLGILLGIQAFRIDPLNWDTRSTLLAGLQTGLEQNVLPYELNIPTRLAKTNNVNLSQDGKTVALSGSDGKIVLWDVTRKIAHELQDPNGIEITAQAFSPKDPNLLVTGNMNNELIFWNLQNEKFQRVEASVIVPNRRAVQIDRVRRLAFSPDGVRLAVHGQSSFIAIWDVASQTQESAFDTAAEFYWDLEWSPNNRYLAAAGGDNTLYIFDPLSGKAIVEQKDTDAEGRIYNLDWSADSQQVAFAGSSGSGVARIHFFDMATRKLLKDTLDYSSTNVYNLSYNHPQGSLLAAAGYNAPVVLWGLKDSVEFPPLPEYNDYQNGMSFRGDLLAYLSNDTISVYEIVVPDKLSQVLPPSSRGLPFVIAAREGGDLLLLTPDTAGGFLEVRSGGESQYYKSGREVPKSTLTYRVAFGPDGSAYLGDDSSGDVYLWSNYSSGVTRQVLSGLPAPINAMAVSQDGNLLATSHCPAAEGAQTVDVCTPFIQFWNLSDPSKINQPITVTQGLVTSLAFSPAGGLLASGSQDGSIYLIDRISGQPVGLPLGGYPVNITSLAFSPDGRILAAGTEQGTLFLWDVSSGQVLGKPFDVSHLPLVSLAFSQDGKKLYASTQNGQLSAWDMDFDSWVSRACLIAGRSLSRAEWRQFIPDYVYIPACQERPQETTTPTPTQMP